MSSPRFFARSLRRWLAASKARAEQLMEATQELQPSLPFSSVDVPLIPRSVRRNALSAERREAARRETQRQRREARLPTSFAASGMH